MFSRVFRGSPDRAWTCDIMINSHALYRLSYRGIWCWPRPIFPDRFQSSIFGTAQLNFRVRNGNGWTLCVMKTNYEVSTALSSRTASSRVFSAPHSLTSVFGMGTGGPYALWALTKIANFRRLINILSAVFSQPCWLFNEFLKNSCGAPSGIRTLDPLIKSQLLYQLS